MHFIFIGLHLAWLALMTLLASMVPGGPFVDQDYYIAVCAVLSGCLSLCFTRRLTLSVVIAVPYFAGLVHLMRLMILELRHVVDHGTSPASTYGTFGLGLLSIGLWLASVWFRSLKYPKEEAEQDVTPNA
jgi:hypothetical protein